jgi:hypothetical protein
MTCDSEAQQSNSSNIFLPVGSNNSGDDYQNGVIYGRDESKTMSSISQTRSLNFSQWPSIFKRMEALRKVNTVKFDPSSMPISDKFALEASY